MKQLVTKIPLKVVNDLFQIEEVVMKKLLIRFIENDDVEIAVYRDNLEILFFKDSDGFIIVTKSMKKEAHLSLSEVVNNVLSR